MDARWRVQYAFDSSKCWSLPYDGKVPDPKILRQIDSSSTSCSSSASSGTSVGGQHVSFNPSSPPDGLTSIAEAEAASSSSLNVDENDRCDDDESTSFQRENSFRKSRTNRYYNARHGSLLTNGGRSQLNNLALGDEDYSSQIKTMDGDEAENEFLRRNSKDAASTPESGPSSTMSTPRRVVFGFCLVRVKLRSFFVS